MAAVETMAATTTERRRRPSPFWLVTGSLAAFFVLLAFLAVQVRAGGDPALGAPKQTAAVAPAPAPARPAPAPVTTGSS
jgi:hypothetical protein